MGLISSCRYLKVNLKAKIYIYVKGTWQWGGFSGVLQKLVPYRSLTLPFAPFQFWLQIRGDICNQKMTPRLDNRQLSDTASRGVGELLTLWRGFWMFKRKLGESGTRRVGDSLTLQLSKLVSCQSPDSGSRGVALVSQGVSIQMFKNFSAL